MRKTSWAVLTLLVVGSLFSCVGCAKEAGEEATKKAAASQQPTSDAPSLGNPKPSEGSVGK
jgi:hypothetical protein